MHRPVVMGNITVHIGCPGCENGSHYVQVDYDLVPPNVHFDGEWTGSDDCECTLTDKLRRGLEEIAEELVAIGDIR